ncbi:unnamed protein product [Mesocestoides corti]|uniref:Uncharacterized protein n=1 Tax=Mesocestoides corti TaxID=53468 RepID=A0A0R3UMB7_MESCO|nr:unnamed protein product [Mesocestoides corti]
MTADLELQEDAIPPRGQVQSDNLKLASAGSIFLATGGTTSSSSQNSSLHKGAGEAHITSEGNVEGGHCVEAGDGGVQTGDASLHNDDPNSVSPYASTSLIEQLRRGSGRGTFPDVIPPPPRYPPPPVPPDSPPAIPGGGGVAYHQTTYTPDECHYAQSDLQKTEEPPFVGAYSTTLSGAYIPGPPPSYPQEQYWGNGAPGVMCYMQQPVVTLSGQMCEGVVRSNKRSQRAGINSPTGISDLARRSQLKNLQIAREKDGGGGGGINVTLHKPIKHLISVCAYTGFNSKRQNRPALRPIGQQLASFPVHYLLYPLPLSRRSVRTSFQRLSEIVPNIAAVVDATWPDGALYMPHMMAKGLGAMQPSMPAAPTFMTQQRGPPSYHHPAPPITGDHQAMMLMMQQQQQSAHPISVLADDVVLPTSTLTHPNRSHHVPPLTSPIHADN